MKKLIFSITLFFSALAAVHRCFHDHATNDSLTEEISEEGLGNEKYEGEGDEEEEGKTDEPSTFLLFHAGIRTREGEEGPRYRSGYRSVELGWARYRARLRSNSSSKKKI